MTRRFWLSTVAFLALLDVSTPAQLRVRPVADARGDVALGLALRTLGTVGSLMMTTAHPDDENNALLAMARYRDGYRTTLVSATRGDGGQNEIGPELFDALAVLRTEELAAVHRFDGAEQYFTRAVDFGFSFSIDETLEKWGKDEILGDYVRHIRTIRPDVIVGFIWDGEGGGQHHQTSARLTAEAFRAAGDPTKFPEQIAAGLRPWQARKFYYTSTLGFGPNPQRRETDATVVRVDADVYDALLGRTYNEIAAEARSMHKCQGMAQLLPIPGLPTGFGGGPRLYKLQDSAIAGQLERKESTMFDNVDTNVTSLAGYAGDRAPEGLVKGLQTIDTRAKAAQAAFTSGDRKAVPAHVAAGLTAVRGLRASLGSLGLDESARFEIDFKLREEEKDFERALLSSRGVRTEALADDGLVMAGQKVKVTVVVATQTEAGTGAAEIKVPSTRFEGFDAPEGLCAAGSAVVGKPFACNGTIGIPAQAKLTELYFRQRKDKARYDFEPDAPFGLPFRPTPFRARLGLIVENLNVDVDVPVVHRYEDVYSGEKRMELNVVPAFAVGVSPDVAVVPIGATGAPLPSTARRSEREIRVTVTNSQKGQATGEVSLQMPDGWKVTPANATVKFSREDESLTVRFSIAPPAGVKAGDYQVTARVVEGGQTFERGYQVVEYPHTSRRHVYEDATVRVKAMDVRTAPNLTVGYIMGVGDQVPSALEQLGAKVEMIDGDALAWGDLTKYDVVMTGVRAYERRADLRAYNQRLLDYASQGGTVLVQYNKFEFNEAQYAPYPAKVGRERVTAEDSELRMLVPTSPVFTTPNKIGASAWDNWVQERGLYFLEQLDPRYKDLLELEDPFPYNAGAKHGALVEASVGKGRWYYIGLGLWRQLPAGTDGAYKLMANLISLGKMSTARPAARPTSPASR
ncbi:MAG: PIG-L family deacetylase [Vicinamibacterales bacterium]